MTRKTTYHLLWILVLPIMTSCATLLSKSTYDYTIHSYPPGAKYTITNQNDKVTHVGQTPDTISLDMNQGYFVSPSFTILYELDGYQPTQSSMRATIDEFYILNILFGGFLGFLVIDPLTGAMWKMSDNYDTGQLIRSGGTPATAAPPSTPPPPSNSNSTQEADEEDVPIER